MPKIINGLEDKLVKVAEELFIREGYDAVNIRKIAKGAGVASGTVYNYFSSKEALYQAVLMDSWDKTMNALQLIMMEELPLNDRIKKFFLTMYLEVESRQGLGGRIILEERKKKIQDDQGTEVKLGQYMNKIQEMLVEMVKQHAYLNERIDDPERLTDVLIGTFWMLQRHHHGEREANVSFIENYLNVLLNIEGDIYE